MYQFVSNEKDSAKKVSIEVDKYVPEVRFKKWGGEVDFGLTSLDVTGEAVYSAEKNITQWKDKASTMLVESYPLKPAVGMEQGGFEIEVVLQEKPKSNTFAFAVSGAENLDFFYQPALDKEKQSEPDITKCSETVCVNKAGQIVLSRPENVVGSYAVYHKGNKDKTKEYNRQFYQAWLQLGLADPGIGGFEIPRCRSSFVSTSLTTPASSTSTR